MIYPEKIQSIKPEDRVLEIGPGSFPHPKANVLLDRRFESEEVALSQRGYGPKVEYQQPIIYYDGGQFPFADKEFDYVICSHVLEHVPANELELFLTELQRIASKGYIEFPNVFYELIHYRDFHKWFMNYRDNTILFLDKDMYTTDHVICRIYREAFYGKDKYLYRSFDRYKHFFFVGFEWVDTINFNVVKNFDTLVSQQDFEYWHKYFSEFEPISKEIKAKKESFLEKVVRYLRKI